MEKSIGLLCESVAMPNLHLLSDILKIRVSSVFFSKKYVCIV